MKTELLEQRLGSRFPSHLICNPQTELLVEGYPRSANSFCVDMIALSYSRFDSRPLRVAHHTHSPDQLVLASQLGTPALILVREPADAILSYHIFSDQNLDYCINRYREFYSAVSLMTNPLLIADFDEVTRNFNAVISKVNSLLGMSIPFSEDLQSDIRKVLDSKLERGAAVHGDRAVHRTGVPSHAREKIKDRLREEVEAAVDQATDLKSLYECVIRMNNEKGLPADR